MSNERNPAVTVPTRLHEWCWGYSDEGNAAINDALAELAKIDALRSRAEAAERRVERLILGLEQLKRMLTVPAAEYVPVIPECWAVINELIDTSGSADRGGEG